MAILLRPPVPRAPIRKGVSGFEVWEETRKRGRQQEDPAASSRGGLSGKAPHCEPPRGKWTPPSWAGGSKSPEAGAAAGSWPRGWTQREPWQGRLR